MFPFERTYPRPSEYTPGTNTCEFIVLHHTGTGEWTANGVIDGLYRRKDYASCHFFVDEFGKAYKFGDPKDILWHAGESSWKGRTDLNRYSVGIEVQGPLSNGSFNQCQRDTVRLLVNHLMATLNVPRENVLRHKDIAPKRKVDVADSFWSNAHSSYADYVASLVPKAFDDKAAANGTYSGDRPLDTATRKEAAILLGRRFGKDPGTIYDGSRPDDKVTRSELDTMWSRAIPFYPPTTLTRYSVAND